MMTHADMTDVVRACLRHPAAAQQPLAVSVVDATGEVSRQWRDTALHPLFLALSAAKASTCVKFAMHRVVLQKWQKEKPLLHMQLSTLDRWPVVAADGSRRLEVGGDVLGGLGISTSDGLRDQQICDDVLNELGYTTDGETRQPTAGLPCAETGRADPPPDHTGLATETADTIVDRVLDHADQLGLTVSVTVVDRTGALLSSCRTHSSARTLELAEAKGYTSVVMGRPSVDLESWQLANPVLAMQLSTMGPHPIIADFGGYPIRSTTRQTIGGLGISGARGEEDQQLCETVLRESGFAVGTFENR